MNYRCIDELLVSGRILKDGHASAESRDAIRRIVGRAYPVTQREFAVAVWLGSTLIRSDDPLREALQNRDALSRVLQAVVAIDFARAERAGDPAAADRLRMLWQTIELRFEKSEALAELLDVGAYKGGLIDSIRPTRPELDYLAIDLDPTHAGGTLSVDRMDATRLSLPDNSVGQVYLLDILEHLHGEQQLFDAVEEAVRVATDFVYAECPNFGDDAYLKRHGLKWCWSDWNGHTLPVTLELFQRAVARLNLQDVADVDLGETVYDSNHKQMVRREAPRDTTIASPHIGEWRPTETVRFDRAIHHRVFLRIRKKPCVEPLWVSPTRRTDLRPDSTRRIPREDWQFNALLTRKLERDCAIGEVELEQANTVLGRIFEGDDPSATLAECAAPPDLLRGMLDLYASAVAGDGKLDLARDLRELNLEARGT